MPAPFLCGARSGADADLGFAPGMIARIRDPHSARKKAGLAARLRHSEKYYNLRLNFFETGSRRQYIIFFCHNPSMTAVGLTPRRTVICPKNEAADTFMV